MTYYSRLYSTWQNMKNRCRNKNILCYKHYGGRGIKVCQEWESFEGFSRWALQNGYNDSLTIDRINTNGNYCPENCRWVSRQEQSRNRRNNIKYKGKYIFDIARDRKEYRFLYDRIKANIPLDRPKRLLRRDITVGDKTDSLRGWARTLGINSGTLHYNLKKEGISYIKRMSKRNKNGKV